jgi:tetratricopeptide (TPR) repeat protein
MFNKAVKLKPNDWAAKVNRGDCYKALGDYNKSITDYTAAYEVNPNA